MNVQVRPPKANLPAYKPSKEEAKLITDGSAFLLLTSPFFGHIMYAEMSIEHTLAVPLAATDARHIYVNAPEMIKEGWGPEEVAFVLAHEVMHYIFADLLMACAWRDNQYIAVGTAGETLPYDHALMNKAMDYRINAALVEGNVGKMPSCGLIDMALSAKGMESCVEIYIKLWKKRQAEKQPEQGKPCKDGPPQPGQGTGAPQPGKGEPKGFDEHLDPTDADVQAEKGNGPDKRDAAVAQALEASHGQGDMPAIMKRLIGELLDPKTKWQDHIASTMRRSAGEPKHDWSKVNKRMITRPVGGKIVFARRANYGCGPVVVGWDTSGSTVKWSDRFFSEMAGIIGDLNPSQLIVIRCDAKVHGTDVLDEPTDLNQFRDQVNEEGVGGGGGTKFAPVFEKIREMNIEPDMVVYLTDGLGSFPTSEPDYPVIWANIRPDLKTKFPFGHVVEISE